MNTRRSSFTLNDNQKSRYSLASFKSFESLELTEKVDIKLDIRDLNHEESNNNDLTFSNHRKSSTSH